MCRFIVYHGPTVNMASLVIDPKHSMLQLARRAHCRYTPINIDGFGVSYYLPEANPIPHVFKDVMPAYESPDLEKKTREINSPFFFAHVRAASEGSVKYENCHPFVYKNISFMHNGTVPYFKSIKNQILERVAPHAVSNIKGSTDSETVFALFITNFEKELDISFEEKSEVYKYTKTQQNQTDSMVSALKATLRQIHYLVLMHEFKNDCQAPPDKELSEYMSCGASEDEPLPPSVGIGRLNIAISDGQTTCTSRYVTSPPETAHTLYYSIGTYFDPKTCQVVVSDSHDKRDVAVISSEPLSSTYTCTEVPVNHMAISGPNAYFSLEPCK